jgi:cytochrome c553
MHGRARRNFLARLFSGQEHNTWRTELAEADMASKQTIRRATWSRCSTVSFALLFLSSTALEGLAQDSAAVTPPGPADTPVATAEKPKVDVRKLFATNCSWCHQDYGMKAADGPKLAGTQLTEEQVIERITRGKTPMPGFRKVLSKENIEALAKYVKGLKDPAGN